MNAKVQQFTLNSPLCNKNHPKGVRDNSGHKVLCNGYVTEQRF
jgi:hypothetical protein